MRRTRESVALTGGVQAMAALCVATTAIAIRNRHSNSATIANVLRHISVSNHVCACSAANIRSNFYKFLNFFAGDSCESLCKLNCGLHGDCSWNKASNTTFCACRPGYIGFACHVSLSILLLAWACYCSKREWRV